MYSDRDSQSSYIGGGKQAHCLRFQIDSLQAWSMNYQSHFMQSDTIHLHVVNHVYRIKHTEANCPLWDSTMHSDRYVFIAGVLYYIQFISTVPLDDSQRLQM